MNQHLSSREFFEYLIGDVTRDQAQHASECAACGAELARLESSLSLFRSSVRQWSDRVSKGSIQMDNYSEHLLTPALFDTPWLTTSRFQTAGISSLLIHAGIIGLIFFLGSLKPVQKLIQNTVDLVAPPLSAYIAAAKPDQMHGGGGGGAQAALDASKGKLPKIAPKQFTPPRVDPLENPNLPMTPTIVAPPDAPIPNISALNYGDPLSKLGVPSNGSGIGTGVGGGVGPGKGPGVGPGSGGGFGGGAYRIGGGVTPPTVLSKIEPEYSEEARKAKWQGTVILELVIDEYGRPQQMRITRPLGLGLDQKAIEAVSKWKFKPGTKDGKAVPVIATIEVNFRLL